MELRPAILRLIVAMALLAVSAGAPLAAETAQSQFDSAHALMLRADAARNKNDLDGAAGLYTQALKQYAMLTAKYPSWQPSVTKFRMTYCNSQLETILTKKGTPPPSENEPVADTEEVVRAPAPRPVIPAASEPSESDQLKNTARQLLINAEPEQARQVLLQILKTNPDDRATRLMIGIAQCQLGKHNDASFVLNELISEDSSDGEAHAALGAVYLGLGKYAESLSETRTAIEISPKMHEAYYNLARTLMAQASPDKAEARKNYMKALDLGAPADKQFETLLAGVAAGR